MQSRLSLMFKRLEGKRAALIAYATGYFPDRGSSAEIINTMLRCGADAVEIGVPFSDPVMDGPVIQETSRIALSSGATPRGILSLAEETRRSTDKPLLLMSYYNPILKYGLRDFARDAVDSGVDAVVIPDLPVEEMGPWRNECGAAGLDTVAFCSITTSQERTRLASEASSGFMYCVALLGTTGPREALDPELPAFIRRVRANSSCPLALGLGISSPEQCGSAGVLVDGVVVGSALMRAVSPGGRGIDELGKMVAELALSLERSKL